MSWAYQVRKQMTLLCLLGLGDKKTLHHFEQKLLLLTLFSRTSDITEVITLFFTRQAYKVVNNGAWELCVQMTVLPNACLYHNAMAPLEES